MNEYLKEQLIKHPSMQPQDVVKMCYQVTFGKEHLVSEKMKDYLFIELDECDDCDILFENISDDYCRINLGCWKKKGYSKELLWQIFNDSKGVKTNKFEELMSEYIVTLKHFWDEDKMMKMENYLQDYYSLGLNPVHHSTIYKENENPHYRIVNRKLLEEKL